MNIGEKKKKKEKFYYLEKRNYALFMLQLRNSYFKLIFLKDKKSDLKTNKNYKGFLAQN